MVLQNNHSYTEYIIKSWMKPKDRIQQNFDYILKGTINYKSMVEEIVDDREELFSNGTLSVFGVTKDQYATWLTALIKRDHTADSQNLLINLHQVKIQVNKVTNIKQSYLIRDSVKHYSSDSIETTTEVTIRTKRTINGSTPGSESLLTRP